MSYQIAEQFTRNKPSGRRARPVCSETLFEIGLPAVSGETLENLRAAAKLVQVATAQPKSPLKKAETYFKAGFKAAAAAAIFV